MSVFESQYADQYDRLYSQKNYRLECDLVEAAVQRFASGRPRNILDVGFGTGRHAVELASRGYEITGVDLSEAMLAHARRKSASTPVESRLHWLRGDIRNFDAGSTFDMAIMMFAVVGYLTRNEDVLQGLRNIRRHLQPGALFICDFWYGPSVLSDRPTDRVKILKTATGKIIRTTQTDLDIVSHTATVKFNLWSTEADRVVSETSEAHCMRYFFPQEFALMLSQSGFSMQSISAFPSIDAPLTDATWNALVVARVA
jgi:SAM-dependent methyltransferase